MQIFGKTAMNRLGEASERAPIRRLDMLRALVTGPVPVHQAELARTIDVPDTAFRTALAALHQAGVVTYATQPTYAMKSRYRATRGLDRSIGRGDPAFYNAVVDYINDRLASASGRRPVVLARDEIEAHLFSQVRPLMRHRGLPATTAGSR